MPVQMSVKDFLNSEDPLSNDAFEFLISYKEEDQYVDYKENFDIDSEKEWLGITVDIMAFANTSGGYLVFGVKDLTFVHVGLPESVANFLSNTNVVIQKINRFIAPSVNQLRTKRYRKDDKDFILLFVPVSKGQTHIAVKEGAFRFPSGEKKIVLSPGMIYIRQSSGNQIINPTEFELLFQRRLEHYKASLLDKIARVVEAPPENQVIIISSSQANGDEKKFIISDAPDAIPIKGRSFTVTPHTDEEEISTWIALSQKDSDFIPRSQKLWNLYAKRHDFSFDMAQLEALVKFSLLSEVPAFFWSKGINSEKLKKILEDIFISKSNINVKATIIQTGAFLGKGFYNYLISKSDKIATRLAPSTKIFPPTGPREFFWPRLVEAFRQKEYKKSESVFCDFLDSELTRVSSLLAVDEGGAMERAQAQAIDCYLYARDDKYVRHPNGHEHERK